MKVVTQSLKTGWRQMLFHAHTPLESRQNSRTWAPGPVAGGRAVVPGDTTSIQTNSSLFPFPFTPPELPGVRLGPNIPQGQHTEINTAGFCKYICHCCCINSASRNWRSNTKKSIVAVKYSYINCSSCLYRSVTQQHELVNMPESATVNITLFSKSGSSVCPYIWTWLCIWS